MSRYTIALMLIGIASLGHATEPGTGHIISAPGAAGEAAFPDSIAIDFELETASSSFSEAAANAQAVADRLGSIAPPSAQATLSVTYDLVFMRQKKWTKGKKLRHTFRISVDNVADGEAQITTIGVVESALSSTPHLAVTGFEARLSRKRAHRIRTHLLKKAVANAREIATVVAEESDLRLLSTRSIRVGRQESLSTPYDFEGMMLASLDVPARYFSVSDELASKIRVSVELLIEFETEPR